MALRRREIPNKIVSLSQHIMAPNAVYCTMVPFQHLLLLSVELSPVLFLLVIGDIIQASIAKHHSVSKYSGIRWKMDSFLQHLDYADDICLLSHSVLDAANMLYSLENELLLDLKSTLEKLSP